MKRNNWLGRKHKESTKEKMRLAKLGKKLSAEHKEKIVEKLKGHPVSDTTKELMRQKMRGRTFSKETLEKMKKAKLGKAFFKGKHHSEETKQKLREKRMKQSEVELSQKRLQNSKMSKLEITFQEIVNKHNLPYKYVGNGQIMIEAKCPDFVNINGKKIAIEVFSTKQKVRFRGISIEQWKKERESLFNKYGWDILFFDEKQVTEEYILKIL